LLGRVITLFKSGKGGEVYDSYSKKNTEKGKRIAGKTKKNRERVARITGYETQSRENPSDTRVQSLFAEANCTSVFDPAMSSGSGHWEKSSGREEEGKPPRTRQ